MDDRPDEMTLLPTTENLLYAARLAELELGYPLNMMAELYYEFTTELPTLTQHHDE